MYTEYIYGNLKGTALKKYEQEVAVLDSNGTDVNTVKPYSIKSDLSDLLMKIEEDLKKNDFFFVFQLLKRNRKAQNRLYRMLYPKVLGHISRNSGSEADALDFTQDTIIKLYNKLTNDPAQITNVIGFAMGILRNDWLKELQRRKNRFTKKQKFISDSGEESYETADSLDENPANGRMEILKECMQLLKPDQREFLEYYDLNSHSIKETAIHFSMDEGSVRVKANRCRSYLHKKIVQHPRYQNCFKE